MVNYFVRLECNSQMGNVGSSQHNMDGFLCYNSDNNKYYSALESSKVKLFETEDEARRAALIYKKSAYCYRGDFFEIESVKS